MYTLFGKNTVRNFAIKKHHKMSCKIIVDRSDIDFSLEHLKNCNFIDAYKILRCKKRVSKSNENIFLIRDNNFTLIKKKDFYIQKNTINNYDFYKKTSSSDGVFLMENIIAEFCGSITKIDKNTQWLYVAEHKSSGIKDRKSVV